MIETVSFALPDFSHSTVQPLSLHHPWAFSQSSPPACSPKDRDKLIRNTPKATESYVSDYKLYVSAYIAVLIQHAHFVSHTWSHCIVMMEVDISCFALMSARYLPTYAIVPRWVTISTSELGFQQVHSHNDYYCNSEQYIYYTSTGTALLRKPTPSNIKCMIQTVYYPFMWNHNIVLRAYSSSRQH